MNSDGLKQALGSTQVDNKNVFPELFEAFTVSESILLHDKIFVYVRPTNQSAYNELHDTPVQTGAVRCEVGGFYSDKESRAIAKGTRVLVIKPHASADIGYVLTILGKATPVESTNKDIVSDGSFSFKGDGAGFHVDGKRNLVNLYTTNKNEISLTESEMLTTVGTTQLKINTKAFKIDNSLSSLDIQKNITMLSGGRITIAAGFYGAENAKKDIDIIGSGLLVDVQGGTFQIKSKNTISNQLVKHDEIGAKYSINIGTSLINPVTGIIDTTSYDLNVLNGDINIHTTSGGLFLHASNVLQKDSIKLVTGLAVRKAGFMQGIPPYTSLDLGGLKGIRMETIGAGADTLFIGPNNITGNTTGPFTMTSVGPMSLTAAAPTSITSAATMSLTSVGPMSLTTTAPYTVSAIGPGTMTSAHWQILGGFSPILEPPAMSISLTALLTALITEMATHVHLTLVGPSTPSVTGTATQGVASALLPFIISKGLIIN